jgi:uncharacterized protein (UPF0276 family)
MNIKKFDKLLPVNYAGLGLRSVHVDEIMESRPEVGWFEILADNHLVNGGRAKAEALAIRENYAMSMHCVNMSIGSTDPLNWDYLKKIKNLSKELKPWIISDHLCWTSIHGQYSHELLPLPYNDDTIIHVAKRIREIQDFLEQEIAIENVSTYLNFKNASLSEVDFFTSVVEEANCKMLLDLNNIYVSNYNTGEDIETYIDTVNWNKVTEIHLAGYEERIHEGDSFLLDTHGEPVHDAVWKLYEMVLERSRDYSIPTLIEWDNNIPEWQVLYKEMQKIQNLQYDYKKKEKEIGRLI